MKRILAGVLIGLIGVLCTACNTEDFANGLPTTMLDVNRILDNTNLSAQQKRTQLEGLGISPSTVNALLQDERTGNQYGGDLRTAWTKVTGGRLRALTPDEVQIYGDAASAVSSTDSLNVQFTDDEASDVTVFFKDFNITTTEELGAFLDSGGEPSGSVAADTYRGLFVDFDPNTLITQLP